MQETFLMIKPDGIKHKEEIFKVLEANGLEIKVFKEHKVDMEIMKNLLSHYQFVIEEMKQEFNFVGKMFNTFYYGDEAIIPMHVTYAGEDDIIKKTRTLVGATNPEKAEVNTIRNLFSTDNYTKADADDRLVNNVIHASDSKESAQRELEIWQNYL